MSDANEAEPAFPQGMAVGDVARMHGGLTKREWIAGQVLAGIAAPLIEAAGVAKEDPTVVARTIAHVSVGLTDALLAELAKVSP